MAIAMSRTPQFDRLSALGISRRNFLAGAAAFAVMPTAKKFSSGPRIAIIGGGLAGLVCADRLESKGYRATVFEASTRLGGRCFTNRTLVPGMAAENGGEFIDTGHKTMLAYANAFGLARESVIRKSGDETYYFFGRTYTEAEVVAEFRAVAPRFRADAKRLSGAPSATTHTAADIELDNIDLATYFASRCQGFPLVEAVLNEAYLAEYGLETLHQSALNFLLFMRLNRQSKFEPFGVSDERYHLLDGNDGIVHGLAEKLASPIQTGATLTKIERTMGGGFDLTFGGAPERFDAVVLALPFTVLRTLDYAGLDLPADKVNAIETLGYGTNAKTMVAFDSRPWANLGRSGGAYSDLPNLQTAWETNRGNAVNSAIVTDYASGDRGTALSVANLQPQVAAWLADYGSAIPGVAAAAKVDGGGYVAHLEHWPSNPLSRGSYTCYTPGQFTTVEGVSGRAEGALKFAGEHADSFYSWQGYMEGACLSGIRAANEVLADIKSGAI